MNEPIWKTLVRKYIEWKFRIRTVPLILFSGGAGILVCTLSPLPKILAKITIANTPLQLSFEQEDSWISDLATLLGITLMVIGAYLAIRDYVLKERSLSRKRRLSIEIRGLNLTLDRTIEDMLSSTHRSQVLPMFLDLRRLTPQEAILSINTIPNFISQSKGGKNDNDIEIFIGGLAPVPFLFVAGAYLTNQTESTTLDWNRDSGQWTELVGEDDGVRLPCIEEKLLNGIGPEIVLTVSTSYTVNEDAISATFGNTQRLDWRLPSRGVNSHWSQAKQNALSAQFRDLLIELDGRGVRVVHLILACQASLAINFGKQLHRRNMPEIRIYQYSAAETPPHPWCVRIPTDETRSPEII